MLAILYVFINILLTIFKMNQSLIIKGLSVHAEGGVLSNSNVVILGTTIDKIAVNAKSFPPDAKVLEFPEHWHLVPGFIDMHIHGAMGVDCMDADLAGLAAISRYLPEEGVTSFLATTMASSKVKIEKALCAIKTYYIEQTSEGSELIGINLEGPFLSSKRCGAQPLADIIDPDLQLLQKWQDLSGNLLRAVTVAPERAGALSLITYLRSQNVSVAFGHSEADYEQGLAAIDAGLDHVTHLFNAMPGIGHRNPNAIIALLLDSKVTVELIADGIHVHPAILKLALKLKGAERIILVSDGIRAKGLGDGDYDFVGQLVQVRNGVARLSDGTLAGSVMRLDQALRNMLKFTDCSLTDVLKMVTENPARKLGIFDRKGSIASGKDADLVVLDENYRVKMTVCRGNIEF